MHEETVVLKHRWYQFRLWKVLVLIAVIAILCAALRVRQTRRQRAAKAVVWDMGGWMAHEMDPVFREPLGGIDYVMSTGSRGWIIDLSGENTPNAVLFGSESELSDEDIEELMPTLQRFPKLKAVFLDETQVTNEGVKRLQQALPDCQISRQLTPPTGR